MRRAVIVTLLTAVSVAVTVALPSPAHAQDAARAAQLNREAAEHAKQDEWNVARALLTEAHQMDPSDASLLVNLAAAELKSNDGVAALRHLRAYLDDPRVPAPAKHVVETELLPRAMAATGHLTIHFPAGARVVVDNETLATDATSGVATDDVAPGTHSIEAQAPGTSATIWKSVAIKAGGSADVRLVPDTPPPAAAAAPPSPEPQHLERPRPVDDTRTSGRLVSLGLLVGGVALAGVGTYFAVDASSKLRQADDIVKGQLGGSSSACTVDAAQAPCQTLGGLHSDHDRELGLANAFFISGGVLAVGAAVTWLAWPRSRSHVETDGVSCRPYVTAGGGGLVGAF